MSDDFDFSQLEQYCNNWLNMQDDFEEFLRGFLLEMAQRALMKIKKRTPVITGDLRNHWEISEVRVNGDALEVDLFNPLEYAGPVEYGHRQEVGRYVPAIGKRLVQPWVNGQFMMTISVDEVQKEIPARFEKAFGEYLASKGAV